MSENRRIGIVGSAGTGKSAFGVALARELGIEFLPAKAITLDILNRDGYDHGSGVQVEKFLASDGRQDAIFKKTIAAQKAAASFVTDRTVIDLAAYVIAERHAAEDIAKVTSVVEACRQNVGLYSHLIVCPWGRLPLRANSRRTLNPWYQFIIHSIDTSLMSMWLGSSAANVYVLESDSEKERVAEVVKFLGK